MDMKFLLMSMMAVLPLLASCQQEKDFPEDVIPNENYEYLPDWQEGYLDIHQISTGKGNCAFMILPDGTTMVVDCGDLGVYTGGTQEIMKPRPNSSKSAAEWDAQYIRHFSAPLPNDSTIDYALVTHFHNDHMGQCGKQAVNKPGLGYKLTGITHLANLLDIKTLIDRGYPDQYARTTELTSGADYANYKLFAEARARDGKKTEAFKVGSSSQIVLRNPSAYPNFEIRNVVGNGKIWTGSGTGSRDLVPATATGSQQLNENQLSCGIRISYGDFDYWTGGDILGVNKSPEWFDIETPVSNLIGETDVVLCNHHAYSDAMCETFVSQVKAQAFIIPVWDYYHPQPATLGRMLSQTLYPADRDVYAAGLVTSNRERLGTNGQLIKPAGHIVTRVYPGGGSFQIFVLSDKDEKYEIIYKSNVYTSNK